MWYNNKMHEDKPEDADTTNPSSAEMATEVTGCSWPVNVALGVGWSIY